jgi:hypothetical protein
MNVAFLVMASGLWTSSLESGQIKVWMVCELPNIIIGNGSPPLKSGQIGLGEVCDLPNIIMRHERLHGLFLDPLFSSAVLNWHILQVIFKGLSLICLKLILDL